MSFIFLPNTSTEVSQEFTDQAGSPNPSTDICRLDYCNSALTGVDKVYFRKLVSAEYG